MARQRRPSGTFRTATVEWKLRVRAVVDASGGISRTELADATGVTSAAISQLLGREDQQPKKSSTRLMPAIHKALGWRPPTDGNPDKSVDDLHDELTKTWPTLDETERAVIAMIVARRTKKT